MIHVNRLQFENFKIFKSSQPFDFTSINVLTGSNSSGKSSVIKGIRILHLIADLVWTDRLLQLNDKFFLGSESGKIEEKLFGSNYKEELDFNSGLSWLFAKINSFDFLDHIEILGKADEIINKHSDSNCFSIGFVSKFRNDTNLFREPGGQVDFICTMEFEKRDEGFEKIGFKKISIKDQENTVVFESYWGSQYSTINLEYFLGIFRQLIPKRSKNRKILSTKESEPLLTSTYELIHFDFNDTFIEFKIDDDKIGVDNAYTMGVINILSRCDFPENFASENIRNVEQFVNNNIVPIIENEVRKNGNWLEFEDGLGIGNVSNVENLFLPFCKFSFNQNGQAIANILKHFIYSGLFNLITEGLYNYKKVKFLNTNRTISRKELEIKSIVSSKGTVEEYFNQFIRCSKFQKNIVIEFIRKALSVEYLDLAEDFEIKISGTTGSFLIKNNGIWQDITEVGTGVKNILSVVFILAFSNDFVNSHSVNEDYDIFYLEDMLYAGSNLIVVEEPEMNLHPKAQSRLADLFILANRQFHCLILIETHSEYLIRKLQYLTAKSEIEPRDTQIYYFHHPDRVPEGDHQVYPININEDGSLTKGFGVGFFDEASELELQLYKLKRKRSSNG